MTAYKVKIKVYDVWKTTDRGGFVKTVKYFDTEEKAKAYANAYEKNPWFFNYDGEEAPVIEDWQKGTVKIKTIEIE